MTLFRLGFFNRKTNLLIILVVLLCTMFSNLHISSALPDIPYCKNANDCSLKEGVKQVKEKVSDIEKEKTLSVYIQEVVGYLITFLSVIAILYIIYAGAMVLVGVGEADKLTASKKTIFYVGLGLAIIWLAWPVTTFIISLVTDRT